MLCARMRADLSVYLETITQDADARKGMRHDRQRVARARIAYQAARTALAAHVEAHDATATTVQSGPQTLPGGGTSRHGRESGMRARRASA
jgi:hypothetical protein